METNKIILLHSHITTIKLNLMQLLKTYGFTHFVLMIRKQQGYEYDYNDFC